MSTFRLMLSIVLERARTLKEYQLDHPQPDSHEVLLRMEQVCLLDRDLDAFYYGHGKLPRVFGSSMIATVVGEEAESPARIIPFFSGSSGQLKAGTRVIVFFDEFQDGALREYAAVPVAQCFPIEPDTPEAHLSLLPDMAIAAGTISRLNAAPGQTMVVLGARAAGLSLALAAQHAGLSVFLVDPHRPRLTQAEGLGISQTINPIVASLPEELEWLAGGRPDFVIDTSGQQEHMPAAVASLGAGSVLGLTAPVDYPFNLRDVAEGDFSVQSLVSVTPDVQAAAALVPQLPQDALVSLSVPLIEIPAVVPSIIRERGTFLRLIGYQT
jgi:threonine dehydrogenase-like Zn-dependent dehydrogenase